MNAAFAPLSSSSGLPVSLDANPLISNWLSIDETQQCFNVYSGKVELGQHILTAIAQIAAHELGVSFERVRMMHAVTGSSPDESVTSGSLSIQHSGMSIRMACRHLRRIFVQMAAEGSGVSGEAVVIRDGHFHAGDRACGSYWELASRVRLDVPVEPGAAAAHEEAPQASITSLGMVEKTVGRYGYIHDMKMEGAVHGRMLRPPSIRARLLRLDTSVLSAMDGIIAVAQDGSLVGVLAEREHVAERAVRSLEKSAVWEQPPCLPDQQDLPSWLRKQQCDTTIYTKDVSETRAAAVVRTCSSDYFKPFIKHASIAPSCAHALTNADGTLNVWTHSQGIYNLRKDLSVVFGMDESRIVVHHVPGAGCYGHNGADDVAFDAAWLSRHAQGRPVRVQWSRADELCWAPQSPAMSISIEADIDEAGNIADWRHQVWSPGHSLRPGRAKTSTLLGSWYQENPNPMLPAVNAPIAAGGGAERNIVPSYDIPCSALASHRVLEMPIRTSALRCLGAFGNVFAIESMLDDIAIDHGVDPIDYRLRMISDPRAAHVLRAVRERSAWSARRAEAGQSGEAAQGWGVGFAQYKSKGAYCAVVAHVVITHKIVVNKLYIVVDVGEVINPDGVIQQVEGGAIQATSWITMESAGFNENRLTDTDWEQYPIIRFSDVPQIDVQILPRPDLPPLGAGECSLGPVGAAIGNAVRDALGVRINAMPITFERMSQAIEESI